MTRYTKSCGLTLWEILFVVVLLLFLVGVIVPALCRVRSKPFRLTCGVHLSGIGKAMLIYANDYDGRFPCAGGPNGSWAARTPNWMGQDSTQAYGMSDAGQAGGQASISASLYLLVKYMEVEPRQFLCFDGEGNIEKGASVFKPGTYGVKDEALIYLWDFGPDPPRHVSYAYHQVYGPHKLTTDSDPSMALAADRNPWMDSPFGKARDFSQFTPDVAPFNGTKETALGGNALAHKGDGQNVLFLDTHVEFAKRSFCGVEDDNIYTFWDGADKVRGKPAALGSVPAGPTDSLLVNDPAVVPQSR